MMKYLKKIGIVAAALAFSISMARADEWDKQTKITINEAIQLPNIVLQPGTYVLTLDRRADPQGQIVRVWDQNQTHQLTMVRAIPNRKIQPVAKVELTFWETPEGQPRALRAWFYPGDDWGQEFKYPKAMAERISSYKSQGPVPVEGQPESNQVSSSTPAAPAPANSASLVGRAQAAETPAPVETAQADRTPPRAPGDRDDSSQAAAPTPVSNPPANSTPDTLPSTASNLPLIALIGICAFVLGAGSFVYSRYSLK